MKKVLASAATRKRLEEVLSCDHIDPSRIVREATRLSEQALVRGLRRSEATYLFSRIVDHNLRTP